ncbi:MAG: DnaA/Hda family protein [Litoreibacter sp.]
MSRQLPLHLPLRPALGRESLIVTPCNAMAMAVLDDCKRWPEGKLTLCGASGAGKTHMAHVWAGDVDAKIVNACDLKIEDVPGIVKGPRVIENIQDVAGDREAETTLFHLHNLMRADEQLMLFTSDRAPAHLPFVLPDLKSRLEATALVTLEGMDDMLLTMLIVKLFTDRQLPVKQAMLDYTVKRIDRSFAAVQAFVEKMDKRALAGKRKVNRALAKEVLAS